MISSMFLLTAFVGFIGIASVYGDGELIILHSPEGIPFSGHTPLDLSQLKDVFSAVLGYTVEVDNDWNGLEVLNPFSYADAVISFIIPGVKSLDSKIGQIFPINIDEDVDETYETLLYRTMQRFPSENQTSVKIILEDDPQIHGTVKILNEDISSSTVPSVMSLNYLYLDASEDIMFIRELKNLRAVSNQLIKGGAMKRDGIPALLWIVLPNLSNVSQFHGIDSDATEEAKKLLLNELLEAKKLFANFYKDKVLVAAVTNEQPEHQRLKRSTQSQSLSADFNIATDYDVNFPVIFNIILWFSIVLIVAVTAISMAIAGMDPGRDSIIYRMTSTRMKKDN